LNVSMDEKAKARVDCRAAALGPFLHHQWLSSKVGVAGLGYKNGNRSYA
jgi:hypothetical protein